MHRIKSVISDPSLEHLDKKIFIWLLVTVVLGIIAGIALSDFDDDKNWRNSRSRNARAMRAARPALRNMRRRSVCFLD